MTRMRTATLTAAVVAVAACLAAAQGTADLSGSWRLDDQRSSPETRGISPQVSFPTDLVIKLTAAELHLQTSTVRQDSHTFAYKLDGTEAVTKLQDGMVVTGKAVRDGQKVVVTSKRVFSSELLGEFVADYVEMYSVTGNTLSVDRVQTIGGVTLKATAIYTKQS